MSLHSTSGRWRLGLALSLVAVFLWGVLPIALVIALQALDVYTITWFRFFLSFVLLAIYLAKQGQLPKLKSFNSTSIKLLAIACVFLGINYLLFVAGLALTSPATSEVLIQLAPVLMGLGGLLVFKERYTLRQWIGLGVLALGFTLFFNEQLNSLIHTSSRQYLIGSGLIILASASWAVYALAQKQLLQHLSSANIMLIIYGICTLAYTPVAQPLQIFTLTPIQLAMLIFCGFNTLLAYGAFAESLEHWEASRVSAILATTPIVTLGFVIVGSALLPSLITSEHFSLLAILGAILVVAGSVAIALGKRVHRS